MAHLLTFSVDKSLSLRRQFLLPSSPAVISGLLEFWCSGSGTGTCVPRAFARCFMKCGRKTWLLGKDGWKGCTLVGNMILMIFRSLPDSWNDQRWLANGACIIGKVRQVQKFKIWVLDPGKTVLCWCAGKFEKVAVPLQVLNGNIGSMISRRCLLAHDSWLNTY